MVKNLKNKALKVVCIAVSVVLCIIAIAFMPKIINAAASYFCRKKTHSVTKAGNSKLEVVKKEEVDK